MMLPCLTAREVALVFCPARFRTGIFNNQLDNIA